MTNTKTQTATEVNTTSRKNSLEGALDRLRNAMGLPPEAGKTEHPEQIASSQPSFRTHRDHRLALMDSCSFPSIVSPHTSSTSDPPQEVEVPQRREDRDAPCSNRTSTFETCCGDEYPGQIIHPKNDRHAEFLRSQGLSSEQLRLTRHQDEVDRQRESPPHEEHQDSDLPQDQRSCGRNETSSTPPHLRVFRQEFDRKLEIQRAARALEPGKPPLNQRQEYVAGKVKRAAMLRLDAHLADTSATFPALALESLHAALASIPNSRSLEKRLRGSRGLTPERQAQIEQQRMWAGCGIMPPDMRKKLTVAMAAYLSRVLDIVKTAPLSLCNASVATICETVGVCRRTGQRVNAMIARGVFDGLVIDRPINRGPQTDTNVIRIAGALKSTTARKLREWIKRNRWGGRLFSHPKEIVRYSREVTASETDPRIAFEDDRALGYARAPP